MVLNYIFVAFFLISFLIALLNLITTGDFSTINNLVETTFSQSKVGFEISLYLTGILCLWLGLMKIAEKSGMIMGLAKVSSPVLSCLFPSIPKGSPIMGDIMMNISANLLGLDNAATPIGLKAMQSLQAINPDKERASNAMIMFTALNASGLTLIPTSIIAYRMQAGAANPADIFIPILIATAMATITVIITVGIKQKINLFRPPLMLFITILITFIGITIYSSKIIEPNTFSMISRGVSSFILMSVMILFLIMGIIRKINVYEAFIEGAKEGFNVAISIVPYLIAILVAVGLFRTSGAMDYATNLVAHIVSNIGIDSRFVDALPTILMKPLSGSGARGLMVDAMNTFGADSLVGRLACVVQGASDTTFYIIAVYFGAVKIRNTRYTIGYSLLADLVGAITAIVVSYLFFG